MKYFMMLVITAAAFSSVAHAKSDKCEMVPVTELKLATGQTVSGYYKYGLSDRVKKKYDGLQDYLDAVRPLNDKGFDFGKMSTERYYLIPYHRKDEDGDGDLDWRTSVWTDVPRFCASDNFTYKGEIYDRNIWNYFWKGRDSFQYTPEERREAHVEEFETPAEAEETSPKPESSTEASSAGDDLSSDDAAGIQNVTAPPEDGGQSMVSDAEDLEEDAGDENADQQDSSDYDGNNSSSSTLGWILISALLVVLCVLVFKAVRNHVRQKNSVPSQERNMSGK